MSDNPYGSSQGGYGRQTLAARPGARPARAPAAGAGNPSGGELIKDTTTAAFSTDVLRESRSQPVLVDFWAPWCGPCKQLTPVLEKVVKAAGGRVKLVKMNIDEHPSIAGQLGVQSIPAVFAFVNGQPVDGFMGALPESEIRAFIERLAGGADDALSGALEEAATLFAAGDAPAAAQLYAVVLQHEPDHAGAVAGLAECYLALNDPARAQALIDQVPPAKASDPALASVRAKLKLAAEIAQLGDPAALQARIEGNADDHQARYDLALIAQARGQREEAAGHLLEIIRRDRSFMDDGARRKLLEFFDAWGPAEPATREARRRLSSLLFS